MKRFLITGTALAATLLVAGIAHGQIVGTAHDFSNEAWSDGEICKPCHTPHHAIAAELSGRIWNHTLSTETYTLHAGGNPDPTKQGGQEDMDRISRLCLSCHDGSVALDSFGGKTDGTTFIASIGTGSGDLSTDLSNDHPVGIAAVYKEEYAPGGGYSYKPIASAKSAGLRFNVVTGQRTYTNQAGEQVTANNEAVGCNTCHNPHGTANSSLLRATNDGSNLCLSCHNK